MRFPGFDIPDLRISDKRRIMGQFILCCARLDEFVTDEDKLVQETVSEQGYKLDQLIDSENRWVRVALVKQGYGLDQLVKDEDSDATLCGLHAMIRRGCR